MSKCVDCGCELHWDGRRRHTFWNQCADALMAERDDLRTRAERAESELAKLREDNRWREYSAKEMPPVDKNVLVVEQDGEISVDCINKAGEWGYNHYNVPNYWRPLPPAPEQPE